jgi:UDP-N-acetylmuramate dehydrogenase
VPLYWVGLGSNLLVRDGGVDGVVISTHGALDRLERQSETHVFVEAGVACARIAKQCIKWGLGPAEFFAGIPGTMGGALAMNAGAFGGETWTHVVEVETVDRRGHEHKRVASEYTPTYRHVEMPVPEEWFLSAKLSFERKDGVHESQVRDLLAKRKASQPIGEWSGGSTFTNPPGDHAARLIEVSGLKGFRVGDASVSEKHANFIINHGHARAADIEGLIEHVQNTVERQHGVLLHPEVRIVGRT